MGILRVSLLSFVIINSVAENSYSFLNSYSYSYNLETCDLVGLYVEAAVLNARIPTLASAVKISSKIATHVGTEVSHMTGLEAFCLGPFYSSAFLPRGLFGILLVGVFGNMLKLRVFYFIYLFFRFKVTVDHL
jgi:hypothetical protein